MFAKQKILRIGSSEDYVNCHKEITIESLSEATVRIFADCVMLKPGVMSMNKYTKLKLGGYHK